MRSIREFSENRLLGKWVGNNMGPWGCDTYYCVGESQDNIYLWYGPYGYGPYGYGFGEIRVHKYAKVLYDENENPVSFYVSKTPSTDSLCFGWDLYDGYKGLDYNLRDEIKWIK